MSLELDAGEMQLVNNQVLKGKIHQHTGSQYERIENFNSSLSVTVVSPLVIPFLQLL